MKKEKFAKEDYLEMFKIGKVAEELSKNTSEDEFLKEFWDLEIMLTDFLVSVIKKSFECYDSGNKQKEAEYTKIFMKIQNFKMQLLNLIVESEDLETTEDSDEE